MKKYQNRILLVCMILVFTMCKKESKLQHLETANSKYNPASVATTIYDWQFDVNMEGWKAGNASATVSGGTLNLTTTGTDPLIKSPANLEITAPLT